MSRAIRQDFRIYANRIRQEFALTPLVSKPEVVKPGRWKYEVTKNTTSDWAFQPLWELHKNRLTFLYLLDECSDLATPGPPPGYKWPLKLAFCSGMGVNRRPLSTAFSKFLSTNNSISRWVSYVLVPMCGTIKALGFFKSP